MLSPRRTKPDPVVVMYELRTVRALKPLPTMRVIESRIKKWRGLLRWTMQAFASPRGEAVVQIVVSLFNFYSGCPYDSQDAAAGVARRHRAAAARPRRPGILPRNGRRRGAAARWPHTCTRRNSARGRASTLNPYRLDVTPDGARGRRGASARPRRVGILVRKRAARWGGPELTPYARAAE